MRATRDLPEDLVAQLRRARALEALAGSVEQQRHAVAGTGALMLAAVEAGWKITDLARAMGLRPKTASQRVRDARTRRDGAAPGLIVSEPAPVRGPLAELDTPAEDRQWLTRAEAAAYLGVDGRTVHGYFKYGLLPNSRKVSGTWRLYLRVDLDRIRNGPRRGVFVDRVAMRRDQTASRSRK